MMDEKQIESLKRRYGSRIADAPKRRRGPERMAVMKGGKPKAGGQTMLRLLSYLKRDRIDFPMLRLILAVPLFCLHRLLIPAVRHCYIPMPILFRLF